MKPFRSLLLAAALAVVSAPFPATPAGATVNNTGTITDGTMTIGTFPNHSTVDLTGATGPCPTSAPTVGLDLTTSTTGWTTALTAFNPSATQLSFTHVGSTYFLGVTRRTTPFSYTGTINSSTPPYQWRQAMTLDVTIRPETAPGSCVAGSVLAGCTAGAQFSSLQFVGVVASGGITGEAIDPGSELRAVGSTPLTGGLCPYPFGSLSTSPATFTDLEVTFP